jgi:NTP pyrophosphatase (non-canonical NTP hydrolase)
MSCYKPTALKNAKLVVDGAEHSVDRLEMFVGPRGFSIKAEAFINTLEAHAVKPSLIEFAKSGAPPVEPYGFTRSPPALLAEGNTSDHHWVDSSPTYSAVLAARDEKHPTRSVPRMAEQKPWRPVDFDGVDPDGTPFLSEGAWTGKFNGPRGLYVKHLRPASLSRFALDFHASNQRWWTDLVTGEKIERNMGEMLMLVVSEIAEAMEGERKNLMDDHLPLRKMAEVELADAVIRVADIVGSLGDTYATKFERRLEEIKGTDYSHSENRGEQLLRICMPLLNAGGACGRSRREFLVNKLARIVHRIELYAAKYGYDLWTAVFEKMEYNTTRADHTPEARKAANGKKF